MELTKNQKARQKRYEIQKQKLAAGIPFRVRDNSDAKKMARLRGEKVYQGTICIHKHHGLRYTRNGNCIECNRDQPNDLERTKAVAAIWRANNKDKIARKGRKTRGLTVSKLKPRYDVAHAIRCRLSELSRLHEVELALLEQMAKDTGYTSFVPKVKAVRLQLESSIRIAQKVENQLKKALAQAVKDGLE